MQAPSKGVEINVHDPKVLRESIKEVRFFFPYSLKNPYCVEGLPLLMVFMTHGENFNVSVDDSKDLLTSILTILGLPVDKAPRNILINSTRSVFAYTQNEEWNDDDYMNLGILLEAMSKIHNWKFTPHYPLRDELKPTFSGSLKS